MDNFSRWRREGLSLRAVLPAGLLAGLAVILAGLPAIVVGLIFVLTVSPATAAPVRQDDEPPAPATPSDCQECHLDVANHWSRSPHAHAFDDPVFQQQWTSLGEPDECLACHTTNYEAATGEYLVEGVACEACHGTVSGEHPPDPVPILADTDYCGECHTTTLGEWHRTGHATEGIGCMDCHDPHNQHPLFAVPDQLCINCHEETMEDYLEDLHGSKGIGCVDCHALVIPPEEMPEDGIVPTGHAFDITPQTCVACHTDSLHAGFSLPGYENGASNATVEEGDVAAIGFTPPVEEEVPAEADLLSPEQRLQTLEAALASRNVTTLFQGGLVGLVMGGLTAWFVASNVRSRREVNNHDREERD